MKTSGARWNSHKAGASNTCRKMSLGLHIHHWLCEGCSERHGQFVSIITSKSNTAHVVATLKHKGASFDLVYKDVNVQLNGEDCGFTV